MTGGNKISWIKLSVIVVFMQLAACEPSTEKSAPISASKESQSDAQVSQNEQTKQPSFYANRWQSTLVGSQFKTSDAPAAKAYQEAVKAALQKPIPVLALDDLSDDKAIEAQSLFINDERLRPVLFHKSSNEPLRAEVMSVKPAAPGDRVGAASICKLDQCYRIDIYNFFHNITITGIIDVVNREVILVNTLAETQPDLSPRLEKLAVAIAKHDDVVQEDVARYLKELESSDSSTQQTPKLVMASTKSALKNSLCERSRHLCVAPTYVLGQGALWVIVDLTDYRVVGLRWTELGESGPPVIVTERKLENEVVFKNFCEKSTPIERNDWSFSYHLTTSDGLRLADVRYKNQSVLKSTKVVDWHVSYSTKDGFGYSDATGCPMFSSAVVVAYQGPSIEPILENDKEVGFSITQDFRQLPWPAPCNYRYEERYEFYNDGRYRVALSNHGRGCGINGTYRPVLRLELGQADPQNGYAMQRWEDDHWKQITIETWSLQPSKEQLHEQKYSHRLINHNNKGYLIAPSTGAFGDGGRGDNAYIYTTVNHADKDEGNSDLVTLGSCCNSDHRQGPEQFMQPPEALTDQELVLWYVPQMQNDNTVGKRYCWAETQVVDGVQKTKTWPCASGPMFVPFGQ